MGGRPKRASKFNIISVVIGGIGEPTFGCAAVGKSGTGSCGVVVVAAEAGGVSTAGRFRRQALPIIKKQPAITKLRKSQRCFIRQGIQVAQLGALAATKAVFCQVASDVSHLLIT